MKIEILGMGCSKCNKLEEITLKAVEELNISAEIFEVKDPKEIVKYGVMMTPALVIDGDVICYGKLPRYEQIKAWLMDYSSDK